ncbi:Cytochrome P450 monooxygenase BOA4 [Colletotrichum fructicola]|nr:Cytochrome P450 monooxygenase BOA4 [Colletotrichum fructicola]KAF4936815.1 Cytochrome P450 monooxygenase BOA4 [Colletotrichum fructicola]KAF5493248.1 Cytochrome P450 monooxygenase BOA4 [Colletotrichum fructicola]
MKKGYTEYRDHLFKIPTSNQPMVIVPTHLLDDLKAYPEDSISFRREMYDRYLGQYTSVASNSSAMIHSVKFDLTKNIENLIPLMQEEISYAMENFMCGHTSEVGGWTRVPVYALSTRVIALVSGRVFVGLPLSRNEEWIHTAIHSTIDSFVGAAMMWQYPSWSWPIMQWIVPQTKRVRYYRRRVAEMLKPIIRNRLEDAKKGSDRKKPSDMVQWLIDNSNGRGDDLAFQANEHIVMNVAAIHTTGGQLAHSLYDLARHPEYVPQLREEIASVLCQDGSITKQGVFRLKKMDSFLREVQRLIPPSMVSTNRKALKPLKLSNGVIIPAGTSLAASPACVSRDPTIWKDPDEFDGLRFFKLRETEGEEKYQFATVNEDALSFGHGRHACPGRFFASAELKIVLIHILRDYDIELCGDYNKDRPLNRFVEVMAAQDVTYELRFRRRA